MCVGTDRNVCAFHSWRGSFGSVSVSDPPDFGSASNLWWNRGFMYDGLKSPQEAGGRGHRRARAGHEFSGMC